MKPLHNQERLKQLKQYDPKLAIELDENRCRMALLNRDNRVLAYMSAYECKSQESYEVSSVAAYPGFGKMLYAFAMMELDSRGMSLMASRSGNIEDKPCLIWEDFLKTPSVTSSNVTQLDFNEDYFLNNIDAIADNNDYDTESFLDYYYGAPEEFFDDPDVDLGALNQCFTTKADPLFGALKKRGEELSHDQLMEAFSEGQTFFHMVYQKPDLYFQLKAPLPEPREAEAPEPERG